uniref:hypothetical protein n=1 Tax=Pseudonocardia sp. ICBG601 TaxID=2846759 RepID=UPI001CF68051
PGRDAHPGARSSSCCDACPPHFDEPDTERRVRGPKAAVAAVGGLLVAGMAVMLSGARTLPPATTEPFIAGAPEAGATNLISAILVDFRASTRSVRSPCC